ncbi:MAG: M1 family metallopeptidase [Alphaproteobacteria bacterium]|nr:M1 family metallopeptidase [Alphaproteobacteria bacterium]
MRIPLRLAAAGLLIALAACDAPSAKKGTAAGTAESIPLGQLPDTVVPLHYRLELTINPSQPRFGGTSEIAVELQAPAREIFLHGRELTVDKVAAHLPDGSVVTGTYAQVHETGVAKLTFEQELPKGKATLSLPFAAPFEPTPDALTVQTDNAEKYAWTQFEEISARRAFPSFDEPRFKTPFDITVIARKTDAVISNTGAVSESTIGDVKKTVFATTKPLPTYLVALIVGPYDVEDGPVLPAIGARANTVQIRGITVKGKGERSRYALQETPPLLRYLEDYFAAPYPYPKLDLITPPNFSAGGMENAGAITYTERGILLDDTASIQQKRYFALLHAHEVSHQWFGDLVTAKWWDDIWLNEAFASWMGNKAAGAVWPQNEFSRETTRDGLDMMDTDSLSTARAIRQPIKTTDDIFNAFDGLTYRKGSAVLAMFESYLGADAFREGVREHMRRFAHASANVNDFMASLAKGSGKPEVVPAFSSFLNQPGVPLIRAKTTCSGRDAIVELTQSPYGAKKVDDKRQWSVPICIRDIAKGKMRSCTLLSQRSATLTLSNQCGAVILPNADGAGYYRFSLAREDWQKLIGLSARLTPAEQLSTLHSLRAAFHAGDTDAATYLAALRAAGTTGTWDNVDLVKAFLTELRGDLLGKADLPAFEKMVRRWFAPQLNRLGFEPRRRETAAAALLRAQLMETLVKVGRDPATLTSLAGRGASHLRALAQGQQPDPLAAELLPASLWAAILTGGAPVARDAISAIKASSDAEFRTSALSALAAARDPDAGKEIEEFAVSGTLGVRELSILLRESFADAERRPAAWNWLRKDFKAISAPMPIDGRSRFIALTGKLCTDQARGEIEWFFKPMVDEISGAPRVFANAVEAVDRCVSWRKAKGGELAAALGSR